MEDDLGSFHRPLDSRSVTDVPREELDLLAQFGVKVIQPSTRPA